MRSHIHDQAVIRRLLSKHAIALRLFHSRRAALVGPNSIMV